MERLKIREGGLHVKEIVSYAGTLVLTCTPDLHMLRPYG